MTTYSLRCRNAACRHRRVATTHPDDYKRVPACLMCGERRGWRIEDREYNRRDICGCTGVHYPHRTGKHPYCDFHPQGAYNQAKRQGIADEDIPLDYLGKRVKENEPCPF